MNIKISFNGALVAKAKYALHISDRVPVSRRKFSRDEWERVIRHVGTLHGSQQVDMEISIANYEFWHPF